MGNSTRNMLPPLQMRSPQVSNGFAGRKVGTPQTHGGSSTGTQSGSKLQLKPTFTGTSLTACGGSMSPAETESTSPRRPPGPLHRLDGRPLDHLDRCQAWSPPSETFKSWQRRKSFIKIGPTPYLMAAIRNLYKVISRQLDLPLAFLCYSQNKWLPELLTAADTQMLCLYYSNKTDLVFVLLLRT